MNKQLYSYGCYNIMNNYKIWFSVTKYISNAPLPRFTLHVTNVNNKIILNKCNEDMAYNIVSFTSLIHL